LYKRGEQVLLQMNHVRPFNNPAETYNYYDLPFCVPSGGVTDAGSRLGDALAGDRRKSSAYSVDFKTAVPFKLLCPKTFDEKDVKDLIHAIDNDYIYEMFVDGLPVYGFVGEKEHHVDKLDDHVHNSTRYFLFTHVVFSIAYNVKGGDADSGHVIAVNATSSRGHRLELRAGEKTECEFTYAVKWIHSEIAYSQRMQVHHIPFKLGDNSLDIHWLSIVNAFVLVVLLTTFLAIILMRVLKNDFSRYMDADPEDLGSEIDDSGWKQVHGDVFRFPEHPMLLSACVGNGMQILALSLSLLFLAVLGMFYPGNESSLYTAGVVLYALSSGIAGYVSTKLYLQLGGTKWATNSLLSAALFTGPLLLVFATVNSVAISYNSVSAVPSRFIFLLVFIWTVVTFPLGIIGSLRAKKETPKFDAPCKTNFAKREIPPAPWYRSWPIQIFMAGFFPFSAIYIELHYTFSAMWGSRTYTLFGILAIAFLLLLLVTACISIALVYFQLSVEDYRWWWSSFFNGGSIGLFVFAYAVFFYKYRSLMTGALQTAFFFGYSFMISYAFFLMTGSIGFISSLWFVKMIYRSIKSD